MNNTFYQKTMVLDLIKNNKNPRKEEVDSVLKLIADENYAKYFFRELDNTYWVIPLYKNGFFKKYPDPIEVQKGSFQLPGWPAGEYLVRFADQYEDIVMDIIQSIHTENWRVHEILVDAMLKISPSKSAKLVFVIDRWLSGRFSDMLPNKLLQLADLYLENGLVDSAIRIFEYILTPIKNEFTKYRSVIRFRSDHFWVNEYCKKQFYKLVYLQPTKLTHSFEKQLKKTIDQAIQLNPKDAELQVGYYWRMDIPNRLTDRSDADALDILIDGLRDSLAEVCKQSIKKGGKFLTAFLESDHIIFRRIALYTLREYGQNYPSMINQALLQREFLENSEFANEYRGLMRDQFSCASEEVRSQVISWILSGPMDVDSRAYNRAQWEEREVTDNDRLKVREDWILFHLEIIRGFLSGDALSHLNKLTDKYGKQNIQETPHIVITSLREPPSPVPSDELAKKTFEELIHLFSTFEPPDSLFNPRESLASNFKSIVSLNPSQYYGFASQLINPAIRFVYIYNFLSGIREGIKNKRGGVEDDILILCEYIVSLKVDPFIESSGDHEPDLVSAQLEVAHLLEAVLESDDSYLTRKQLDRIRSLLIDLAHHPDPKVTSDESTSFDPFTHSLNCVRGQAMHGIFHYSLYIIRQQEKQHNLKIKKGHLEPEIQQLLEEKLNLVDEPSLAVHSVFGAFAPQLHYLSRGWLEQNISRIFPEAIEYDRYWKAAWDGYILVSNVYKDVFTLLIPQYQRGVRLLSGLQEENKYWGGSPNSRLAEHIMFAYIKGLTDINHENRLLDLFLEYASDSIRAHGIFWLSKVLEQDKPVVGDILWEKCWRLWQSRLSQAETQDVNNNTQEISDYMRWLDYSPIKLDILFPILHASVEYLYDGFDAQQLVKFAAENSALFPLEAVTLLQMSILKAKEQWWMPRDNDEEKILKSALESGMEEAIRIASEVINYRGEHGDFRWKYLLG
jgi:hypothetical protein